MNIKKTVIGGLLTALVIYIWTAFVAALVPSGLSDIEALLMGVPLFMGFFVYLIANELNKMFNK